MTTRIPKTTVAARKIGALLLILSFTSCNKMNMDEYRDVNYDAAYVINGESNTISVIDLNSDGVRKTFQLGDASSGGHGGMGGSPMTLSWPHHFSLNPTTNQLAIGAPGMDLSGGHSGGMAGMKGKVGLVDALSGKIIQALELPAMNHNAIFSPDGKEIWTSQMNHEGAVLVYNAADLSLKSTIPVGKEPAEVTFSADGKVAFVANGEDNTVTAIDPLSKTVKATIGVDADPVGAWPGSDNKMYVDNELGKTISILDVATLKVEHTLEIGFTPGYAAYRAGNPAELWVTDVDTGEVVIYQKTGNDPWNWGNKVRIPTGAGAHAIAFTKDGQKAYITNQLAGTVSVIDALIKKKLKDITVGIKPNGILIRYQ